MIEKLICIFPEWLKFIKHSTLGEMLKIEKTIHISLLIKKLNEVNESEL